MKPICLNLEECNGLGDLISATPTIKKLYESYGQKVTVLSKMPELFKLNPYVEKSYKAASVDKGYFMDNYIMHNSFYLVGKKDERGVEMKYNMMDIRQFHAVHLGFMLRQDELECYYTPTDALTIDNIPEKFVLIHPVTTWATRTWSLENWVELTKRLNDMGIAVISTGKDSSETGFFNVDKPVFDFPIQNGLNLMNKSSIADCWHLMNKALAFVTMDSGLLHLAGTTDVFIIQLGSSIAPEFRAPYRKGSQQYKQVYVGGSCPLFCGSDMKYGVKEWGNIQGVQPMIKCLENKPTFECHPSVDQVLEVIKKLI